MARPIAEAEIDIDAPIEIIWEVMTDLEAYPQWNPFIVRITNRGASRRFAIETPAGPLAVDQELLLHVRWADGGQLTSPEVVTRLDGPATAGEGKRAVLAYDYRGLPHALHLVRGSRSQTVEQAAGAPARYRTYERFTGLLVALLPLRRIQEGFTRHAQALKARAESLARLRDRDAREHGQAVRGAGGR